MDGCRRPLLDSLSKPLAQGGTVTVAVNNPNRNVTYIEHPIRLDVNVRGCRAALVSVFNVTLNGTKAVVPSQVDILQGNSISIGKGVVWILESIAPGQVHTYRVNCSPHLVQRDSKIHTGPSVERRGSTYVLWNSATKLVVAAAITGSITTAPAPFVGMSINGVMVGASKWNTDLKPSKFVSSITGNGPVFARVKLYYEFEGGGSFNISFMLTGSDKHVTVDETFHAGSHDNNDAWTLDLSAGLQARKAVMLSTHVCDLSDPYSQPIRTNVTLPVEASLQPNKRLGNSLGYFFYRWNQGCDAKAAVGSADHLGAGLAVVAARGGKWRWPEGTGFSWSEVGVSLATAVVDGSGTFLGMRFPIYVPLPDDTPGRRVYFIASYNSTAVANIMLPHLLVVHSMHPLDKLLNEYVLWWPGAVDTRDTTSFSNFLDGDATNPTHNLRQIARALNKNIQKGILPPQSLATLATVNQMLDPDWYGGGYFGYVSPENNNFFTDFVRVPILSAVSLVASLPHPQHTCAKTFITVIQQALRSDLFHSITMPSGATQEAPGYLGHSMEAWVGDAPIYQKYFNVNPINNPLLQAAVGFLFQLGHPFNWHELGAGAAHPETWSGRYITPIGDTHPHSVNYTELEVASGYKPVAPQNLRSVELEGFGVVLRSQTGTLSETFLSFKAGPNQGHDHGDQLSIHWCAYGARHAVDLLFGYNPRPLQEFWHNRMSFKIGTSLQNMDGFARLIASKFHDHFDVAVGAVSSRRFRTPPVAPPGIWGAHYPEHVLDAPLNYTRTVLLVKQGSQRDYVVLRDMFVAPESVDSIFNQWYIQDGAPIASLVSNTGILATIDLGNSTLFLMVLTPRLNISSFSSIRWTNKSEGNENATGVRVFVNGATTADVVSVLYPSGSLTAQHAPVPQVLVENDTVKLIFSQDTSDTLIFRRRSNSIILSQQGKPAAKVLDDNDLNWNRSQGQIGLTTLDAGYDFGPVPDWLIRQRLQNLVYSWPINSEFPSQYTS